MSETAKSVQIECLIKRHGGSKVEMPIPGTEDQFTTYHFTPDREDRHVALVSEPSHIERFSRITEGYRVLGEVNLAPVAAAPVLTAPVGVTPAPAAAPQTPAAPAQAASAAAQAPAAPPVTTFAAELPQPLQDGSYSAESVDLIRAIFKAELGRVAPPKSKPETMVAQIEAVRAERANG